MQGKRIPASQAVCTSHVIDVHPQELRMSLDFQKSVKFRVPKFISPVLTRQSGFPLHSVGFPGG